MNMRFIGSKVTLLQSITALLNRHLDGDEERFLDVFGGTNTVGAHFKPRYSITSNDALTFSHLNAVARIGLNHTPQFRGLQARGIHSPIDLLEQSAESYIASGEEGYYELSYSPSGGAMYFTVENAKRLDAIRSTISSWFLNEWITPEENAYLVDALISGIPSISNTTGTYGAFLKHWDRRALSPLKLSPATIVDNQRSNFCFNRDANDLVLERETDIAYIDPPYNSRQYAPNYHVLENIAKDSKPELRGVTRLYDWSSERSAYCAKNKALPTLRKLLRDARAKHVVLSYNSEGIIKEEDLIEAAFDVAIDGDIEIVRVPYRKYKSKMPTSTDDLYEILLYIRKERAKKRIAPRIASPKSRPGTLIKSPLNYIGGKYRLLPQLMPLLPRQSNTFVDLFSGGANVGINASAEKYLFVDMNDRINELFRALQKTPLEETLAEIRETIKEWNLSKTNEKAFLDFRAHYNRQPTPLALYVLSSFSYNYQFRFNSRMEFNNPFGRNRSSFSSNMERNLVMFTERLQAISAEFQDGFFEDICLDHLTENDFVYMDPPYLITTGSYNDGNRGFRNWTEKSEVALLDLISSLTRKKIPVALSNVLEHKGRSNLILADYIKNENLHAHTLNYNYDNASHNSKSKGSKEVLITNYRLDESGFAHVDI